MEAKPTEIKTPTPTETLAICELLPDGTTTVNQEVWLKSWAEFAQLQIAKGKIKLYEVAEYDVDTGAVPNTYIKEVYLKNRRLN